MSLCNHMRERCFHVGGKERPNKGESLLVFLVLPGYSERGLPLPNWVTFKNLI